MQAPRVHEHCAAGTRDALREHMPHFIRHLGVSLGAALLLCALATSSLAAQRAPDESTAADERMLHSDAGKTDYVKPALRHTGIALTVIGGVGALVGGSLILAGVMSECGECLEVPMAGGGIALISVPFLAAGIPMWIVGSRRVESRGVARLLPGRLGLGPTSASMRWEF